ncbi:MAG: hypothetical protein Tsb0020_27070 [Haliangiales bacterium]
MTRALPPRQIHHRYVDALAQIWLTTAARVGLTVRRSAEVYASTDGRGQLYVGTDETLDADDSLAQMIFHELCHALVEGPTSFAQPDWGLDNTGPRDVVREHACLRVQAALVREYDLGLLLAPTTDFRYVYDRLGSAPLGDGRGGDGGDSGDGRDGGDSGDGGDAVPDAAEGCRDHDSRVQSIALAQAAYARADTPPWTPHLRTALHATAAICDIVAPFADPPSAESLPSLWQPR